MITYSEFKRNLDKLPSHLGETSIKCCYYVFLGNSNREVGNRLKMSEASIKVTLNRIYRKLNINFMKGLSKRSCLINFILFDLNNLDFLIEQAKIRESKQEFKAHENNKLKNQKIKDDIKKSGEEIERKSIRKNTLHEELRAKLSSHSSS